MHSLRPLPTLTPLPALFNINRSFGFEPTFFLYRNRSTSDIGLIDSSADNVDLRVLEKNRESRMISKLLSLFLLLSAAMGLTYHLPRDASALQQRNFDTINKIYNLTTYPNNLAFLQGGVDAIPDGLFAEDVVGRVTPLGDFSGSRSTSNANMLLLYCLDV